MNIYQPASLLPPTERVPQFTTACGCLHRHGKVLLERRPDDARVSPGVWDLPGGHLEPGESPEQALVRELHEELGVVVRRVRLGLVQDEDEVRSGRLYRHFTYLVDDWEGEPRATAGQPLAWLELGALCGNPHAAVAGVRVNGPAHFALAHFHAHAWITAGT